MEGLRGEVACLSSSFQDSDLIRASWEEQKSEG